jgi:hypothetical protein
MELNYHKPFHYEIESDSDGVPVLWRVLDAFDAIIGFCLTEAAAKETIERFNESP